MPDQLTDTAPVPATRDATIAGRPRRFWLWLVRHAKTVGLVLSILSFLLGAGVIPRIISGLWLDPAAKRAAEQAKQTAERYQKAEQFVKRYDEGDVAYLQKAETTFWHGTTGKELIDIYKETFETREAQRQAVAEVVGRDPQHQDRVFQLTRFYKDLSGCVVDGRCDVSLTCEKLGKQVYYFESMYRRVLEQFQTKWREEFISHLQAVTARC